MKKPQLIKEIEVLLDDSDLDISKDILGPYPNGEISFEYRFDAMDNVITNDADLTDSKKMIDEHINAFQLLKEIIEKCKIEGYPIWCSLEPKIIISYTKELQDKDNFVYDIGKLIWEKRSYIKPR